MTVRRAWEANFEPGQTLSPTELPANSFLEWRNVQVDDGEFLSGIARRSLKPAGGVGPTSCAKAATQSSECAVCE